MFTNVYKQTNSESCDPSGLEQLFGLIPENWSAPVQLQTAPETLEFLMLECLTSNLWLQYVSADAFI